MMDFLVASIIAFLGISAIFAYYSKYFQRPGFQAFFFSMSMIFLMGCMVVLITAPNISTVETFTEYANVTSEIVTRNTTTTVSMPSAVTDIFGGMLEIMLWVLFFILAVFVTYIMVDSIKLFGKAGKVG